MPSDPFIEAGNVISMFLKKQGGFRTLVYGRKWSTKPAALFAIALKSLVFYNVSSEILDKVNDSCISCDEDDKVLRIIFVTELMTGTDIPDKKRRLQQKTRKNLAFIRSLKNKIMNEIEELRAIYDPIEKILPTPLYNALHPIILPRFVRINIPYVKKVYGISNSPKEVIKQLLLKDGAKLVDFPALKETKTFSFDPLLKDVLCFNNKFDVYHNALIRNNMLITQSRASCLPVICIEEILKKYKIANPSILDACAAPGSKTLQLAGSEIKMRITANDRDEKRVKVLKNRLKECNIIGNEYSNKVNVVCNDFIDANESHLRGKYDLILTDVSCSGSGSTELDMSLTSIHYRTKEQNDMRMKSIISNQKAVLRKALNISKHFVVYSTCSDNIQEDEEVINDVLLNMKNDVNNKNKWDVIDILPVWSERGIADDRYLFDATKCIRSSTPQYTDSFFICVLKKV